MAEFKLNPITGKLDLIGMTPTEIEAYLKLDQTTPQNVINGAPQFDEGIVIKAAKRLYLDGT
jgi:hypothetical protein